MPSYETRRCLLRVIDVSDAAAVFENFSNPATMAYYDAAPVTELIDVERILRGWELQIRDGTRCRWAIVLKSSGHMIGTCGLHGIDGKRRCADLGYEVGQDYWGKGIMSEVFPALLEHAFHELGLERLTARIRPQNLASLALVRKFGFRVRALPQVAGWLRGERSRIFKLTRAERDRRAGQSRDLLSSTRPALPR